MIDVLEILDGGKRAIVSTKNLFRVVTHGPDGTEAAEELLEKFEAKAFAEGFGTERSRKHWAEVVDYKKAFEREQCEPERSAIRNKRKPANKKARVRSATVQA